MEQGFDSLSLTQVAFAIRKEFSVKGQLSAS
jgi:acyl carrier protein